MASLSTRELANFLSIDEKTVQRYARAGEIPATKTNKGYRFVLEAVLDALRLIPPAGTQQEIASEDEHESPLLSGRKPPPLPPGLVHSRRDVHNRHVLTFPLHNPEAMAGLFLRCPDYAYYSTDQISKLLL